MQTDRLALPAFPDTHAALSAIAAHRLEVQSLDFAIGEVVEDDALDALVAFYDEANRSLRLTLAALQSATDHAADRRPAACALPM